METAETVLSEKGSTVISVPPETTICAAIGRMIEHNIGAVVVEKEKKFVGIWTERDLMLDMQDPDFEPRSAQIGDYMTTELLSAPHDATLDQLQDIYLGRRIRHLLIERDGIYIGLLSTGDVIKAQLRNKIAKIKELDDIVHLRYYDAWKR